MQRMEKEWTKKLAKTISEMYVLGIAVTNQTVKTMAAVQGLNIKQRQNKGMIKIFK